MNRIRRKNITTVIKTLEDAMADIELIREEEEEAFENLPESIQYSDRGSIMEEYMEHLDSARDMAEESIAYLDSARS